MYPMHNRTGAEQAPYWDLAQALIADPSLTGETLLLPKTSELPLRFNPPVLDRLARRIKRDLDQWIDDQYRHECLESSVPRVLELLPMTAHVSSMHNERLFGLQAWQAVLDHTQPDVTWEVYFKRLLEDTRRVYDMHPEPTNHFERLVYGAVCNVLTLVVYQLTMNMQTDKAEAIR